jgi:hypothetical protein
VSEPAQALGSGAHGGAAHAWWQRVEENDSVDGWCQEADDEFSACGAVMRAAKSDLVLCVARSKGVVANTSVWLLRVDARLKGLLWGQDSGNDSGGWHGSGFLARRSCYRASCVKAFTTVAPVGASFPDEGDVSPL